MYMRIDICVRNQVIMFSRRPKSHYTF